MADSFGSVEQQLQALSDRMDEYRVRGRSEVGQVAERLDRLEASLAERSRSNGPGLSIDAVERLIDVIRGLRDDMAAAIGEVRLEAAASIDRVVSEQNARLGQLQLPALPAGSDDRLESIESTIASLRDELAIERLETSLRQMGGELERVVEDTSDLRNDVRRSFERVLVSIDNAEHAVVGEVRAIDNRIGGMAEDLRLVRTLRDGLEALAAGVDSVRQLAARSATTSQMTELATDLSAVLAEIEAARAQVLAVDQHVGLVQAGAIDVGRPPDDDVHRSVEHLERTVTEEIGELGRRIEELAGRSSSTESPTETETGTGTEPEDPLVRRLRSLATSARQLGHGMAEDLRSRRGSKRP
jgi:hypothetical protein